MVGQARAGFYLAVRRRGGNRSNAYFLLLRVVKGQVVEWSPVTDQEWSLVTTEVEERKQRKKQRKGSSSVGGDLKRLGSSIEGSDEATVLPLRRAGVR